MNLKKFIANAMVLGLRVLNHVPFIGNRLVQASFEAVRQNWGERSFLWQALMQYWQEIDAMTRQELQRVHQNLVENIPIVQKLRCLFLQFSVGPTGLTCTPNASRMDDTPSKNDAARKAEKSAVENWNHSRGESWEKWGENPDLGNDLTFAQLTTVWAGTLFDRGAITVNLTSADVKVGLRLVNMPRIQTIDPIRIKSPSGMSSFQGRPIIDGIEIDPATGQRVAAWVEKTNFAAITGLTSAQPELFDRIEFYRPGMKGGLIHEFKPRFVGQIRELPEGFAAYNILRDIRDLFQLEMGCAKLSGQIATVEKNASGELDTRRSRQVGLKFASQTPTGATVQKTAALDYNITFAGKNIAMMQGDKLDNFMISRPTVAQQDYWDTLWTSVCQAYNQPKLLAMPYSLQGTVTRADLDVCANAYRFNFEIIRKVAQTIYQWQCNWAIDFDRTMPQGIPPQDACAVFIRHPRSPNVDIGYTAKALEIELRLGVKTVPEVYAERQMDFRQKTREIAEYLAYVKQLAVEFDLQPGQITDLAVEQAVQEPTSHPDSPEGGPGGGDAENKNSHLITA